MDCLIVKSGFIKLFRKTDLAFSLQFLSLILVVFAKQKLAATPWVLLMRLENLVFWAFNQQ